MGTEILCARCGGPIGYERLIAARSRGTEARFCSGNCRGVFHVAESRKKARVALGKSLYDGAGVKYAASSIKKPKPTK
jgi:hypothetical protein